MNQAAEINFVIENPELTLGLSSDGVTEAIDSNENVVDIIQRTYMKNKIGNAKSKIRNVKVKEINVVSQPEGKNLKRKATHPPTSEMVMDSIKTLKKRNGASFEDMSKYMEEKYAVNMKRLKYHVETFLQKGCDNGVLEKIETGGAEERFKIKKSENINKDSKKLPQKEGKLKLEKKLAATKKQVENPTYMKNKNGNAKSKIQNEKAMEMTVVSQPERKYLKRKSTHPPTSEMVMDSIKALKKRNGASFEDISKYMEEKYAVNMKRLKYHAEMFLQKGFDNGVLEKIEIGGAEERFKIKKSENINKDSKNLPQKEGKSKLEKKMAVTKKTG